MSSREFAEWIAYYQLQPFGEEREDQRAGIIAAVIANVYQRKGSKPRSWRDFFPSFETRNPTPDASGLISKIAALNAAFGGADNRNAPAE